MSEPLTPDQFRPLLDHEAPGSVSLFMPAHPAGQEIREDPIRLRNLLDRAAAQLDAVGVAKSKARDLLAPGRKLVGDSGFWRHQSDGLALFLGNNGPHVFRVPVALEDLVVVGSRFHLKPLLPLAGNHASFHVLALSQHQVRLLECTPHQCRHVELPPGVVKSIEELMQHYQPEQSLQMHTETAGHQPGERRPAVHHGQGTGTDRAQEKKRTAEFVHLVAAGVERVLVKRKTPLVLAAAEPALSMFRQQCGYPHVTDREIHGCPDRVSDDDLRARAAELLEPVFHQRYRADAQRFAEAMGHDMGSTDLAEALRAAHVRRVDTLFVPRWEHRWGRFEPDGGTVELHETQQPGDDDLLDLAAVRTRQGGGTVHVVERDEMPGEEVVATVFRFAL